MSSDRPICPARALNAAPAFLPMLSRMAIHMSRWRTNSHLLILVVVLAASAPANAQSLRSLQAANDLGRIMASESFCGLSYDRAAIQTYIVKNVPSSDKGFPSLLQDIVAGHKALQHRMTVAQKTAHCSQVQRIGRDYGFIK
jgi:hypothetical protein